MTGNGCVEFVDSGEKPVIVAMREDGSVSSIAKYGDRAPHQERVQAWLLAVRAAENG